MKIGIEGQRLFRKKKHGMDMVALELIKNLQVIDKINEYVIFVKPDTDYNCIPMAPNFRIVELKKGGTWYQKGGNIYRRFIVPSVVKKSEKVITVSNYEKERIQKHFGINEDKLQTVYNGVGEHFRKITDELVLDEIKKEYTAPKKNTPGVLKAFSDYNELYPNEYTLVMLDYDEQELQKILADIGKPELRKLIHLTGYVSNEKLPAIISQCTVFLYPSLRESFGIPILEGMACGVPVITSNTSSMPEIAGRDTAYIVDPKKPEEITTAIEVLVQN